MKTKHQLGLMISAAAVSLALALSAQAQGIDASASPAPEELTFGLLGTNYANASLRYTDLDGGPPTAMRGAGLQLNQAWKPGVDVNLNYDWARASAAPVRLTFQDFNVGATMYNKLEWGKPFVQTLVGWEWRRGLPTLGSSFAYSVGTGAELQLSQRFALTPAVNFVRATGTNRSEVDYVLKGTYRITREWGFSASAQYDSVYHKKDAKVYTLGVNYHY